MLSITENHAPGSALRGEIGPNGRALLVPTVALPDRALGLGPFSVGAAASGLPQIVDAAGQGWGVFANKQLAQATAARLSR